MVQEVPSHVSKHPSWGRSWDRLRLVLRRALRAWGHSGVLILSCSVLVLAPEYAAPQSRHEQANQLAQEVLRLFRAGRYQEATPLAEETLRLDERALGPTHPQVAVSLNNLAELHRQQGHYAQAEPLYRHALAILEQALGPEHPNVALNLNNLASLYQHQGRYDEAEPLYRRALAISEQTLGLTHPQVALSLNNLAMLYQAQWHYAQAEPLYRRALAILGQAFGPTPTHPTVAVSLGNLATLLAQQHLLARARPLFERARQIYLAVSKANINLEEEAARGVVRQQTQSLRSYATLLATMAREPGGDPTSPSAALAAFVVAEQMRGGAVQMALARAGARAAVTEPATATLARQVEELRRRQRAVWWQLSDAYRTPAAGWDARHMAAQRKALQQVDGELREATQRLHEAFPRYAELTTPAPIEVPAVQALLYPHEALISWLTLPDRMLIWLIRPGQVLVYQDLAITKLSLATMVTQVRRSLEQGPQQAFDVVQAHALYERLLTPLRDHLAGVRHLFLVPDDMLQPLPFGVLVTEATGEAYRRLADLVAQQRRPTAADLTAYARLAWLAQDYALTMLPAATALRTMRQLPHIPGRAGEPLLGFGDPVLQGDGGRRGGGPMPAARGPQVPLEVLRRLPRLPETRAELLAIATALGADPRRALYLGEQATKPMIQALNASGRLGQAQVLAFATHALLAGELTGLPQPALVLTPPETASDQDDGLLTLEDIVGLTLPQASWVVLSACKTAADDGSGEALSGLARAFFHAGAAALLVSQWSVDDKATRVLMTEVFQRQAKNPGLLRAEALRQGMLAMMTKAQGRDAYFAHPYAWAPFVLVGDGGRGRP
jgi:CHAT domain-containing protein